MGTKIFPAFAAIAAGALSMAPATAATFVNGSFEAPGGDIRVGIAQSGTPNFVTGWTDDAGANGGYDIYEADDTGDDLIAKDGTHYVSFGHDNSVGGTLSQTFDVIAGKTYTVSYYVAEQQGDEPAQILRATIVNGLQSISADNGALTDTFLAGIPLTFTATTASATLSFFDATPIGGGDNSNIALDAVSIGGAGAVPEPAVWSMMVCGFGAIGGAVRQRRRASLRAA